MIKNLTTLIVLFCFCLFSLNAQIVYDDFSDGDLNYSPEWNGNIEDFIINDTFQLQLNFEDDPLRSSYISTAISNNSLELKEWRFDIKLDFNPSNSNRVEIYLASTTENLLDYENTGSIQEGYYLEIGENGTEDGVSLFYRNGQTTQLIARGGDGLFASAFDLRVRVRRDENAIWEIAVDPSKGESFEVLASGQEASLSAATSLGFICYFTSSRSSSFYFDNIYFGNYVFDTIPPSIEEYKIIGNNQIELIYNEELSQVNNSNYSLQPDDINPLQVEQKDDTVRITFENSFENGRNYFLLAENISDLKGNTAELDSLEFLYFELENAEPGDIIISEFFPDPTPVLGLPDEEFVEIYNRSDKFIDLKGWKISDDTESEGSLPSFVLYPKEYIILAPASAKDGYANFGEVLVPSSWRSLNNGGDSIEIKDSSGVIIDALAYDRSWFQVEEKSEGGYSLELINPSLICFDIKNWKGSEADQGGTPGMVNSTYDSTFTGQPARIVSFYSSSPIQLEIIFDKKMDMESLVNASYLLQSGDQIDSIIVDRQNENSVKLNLQNKLQNDVTYTITIEEVSDCNGNIAEDLSASFLYDIERPQLDSLFFLSDSILLLTFTEPIDTLSAENLSNYSLSPQITLTKAQIWSKNQLLLIWENRWIAGFPYRLTVDSISDLSGNFMTQLKQEIIMKKPAKPTFNDLIITEIMANPKEDQILPNRQFVEIYNATDQLFSLTDVQFMDERDTVNLGLNYIEPNEYILIAATSAVEDLSSYGRVIALSPWPNLNNRGDNLQLVTDEQIINQAFYSESWYKENSKYDEGGWSLEMIDTGSPCLGISNWRASVDEKQATPGAENSVMESNTDQSGPELANAYAPNTKEVIVDFNEPIDITNVRRNQFRIVPEITIAKIELLDLNRIKLVLQADLKAKVSYTLVVDNLTDCEGNIILSDQNQTSFALAEPPVQGDVVLNEVLYDQKSGGADFIELLNISDKYINLIGWIVKGNNNEEVIFENENVIISPGQFLVITSDKASIIKDYPTSHVAQNIYETSFPALSNGEGVVSITSANEALTEYFEYSDDMHLPFLRTTDGVSLERIHPDAPIDKTESWNSAASSVGFATPGKENSQRTSEDIDFGTIAAKPKTFAHDQPGRNYTIINYQLENVGSMATVKIFDMKGNVITTLANNETLSNTGFFRWDGVDFNGRKVRTGYYIIYFQLFDSNGNTKVVKETVAVGF
ncbi:lamin tail domain-containing protein [Marivirga arenosa]|uniref:Lamin tail domain-containing protein n=1 Tax=Marivirga arenosa TaxID=3059076 RepID=A0AA51ZWG4_9BACT|nr:lamin tail domain-containing protein [Marivirga sp. BKB1-2]WNB17936.1 lamin tail domain-containing protein [Marivirga sp. BKB1-2]